MPALTEDQWRGLILRACQDDGTVAAVWRDLWARRADLDIGDPTGDLRYYAVLRDALDLLLIKAAENVATTDGGGQGGQWQQYFEHLNTLRLQADTDFKAAAEAVLSSGVLQVDVMTAYSLTPVAPGYVPDPAHPGYMGDPRYRRTWRPN